jgi:NAD(P)-dependent dehydrogenase (short-subunit alcohol dehydrogenase family)
MSSCIVTGCAAGNGLAIARQLIADGHQVVGVDHVVPATGPENWLQVGDVLDPVTRATIFDEALDAGHGVVFLVNNAGVTSPEFPQSDKVWDWTLGINLKAPFQWSRTYAEHVTGGKIKSGGIVFIGSLATTMGFPRNPAYQASKSGLTGLTRAFAFDLGPFGIRSNCVSPGHIQTAMTMKSYSTPELHEARKRHMLLGRWGQPQDVADAVSFLCSSKSAYITGVNLPVDGGWMACGLTN